MKKVIAMLLALVMVLGLVACGSGTASTDTTAAAATKAAETTAAGETKAAEGTTAAQGEHENVTIEAHIVQTDWSDAWDEMESSFEAQYPWINVEAVGIGETNADFISARAAANDLPDIVQVDNDTTWRKLTDDGKVMDLSGLDVCQYVPQSYLDAFTYNGVLMGITQGAAFSCMYYNMDLLSQAGWDKVPTNWDELIQCCKDVKEKTDAAPLTIAGAKTTTMYFLMELLIANVCGDELGQGTYEQQMKDGKFDFTKYPDLAAKLEEIAPYFLTGSATMTEDDVTAAMTDGTAAMCIAGNWTAGTLCPGIAECTGDESKVAASLVPFNAEGKQVWTSVSPETAFGITVDENRSADEQEACEIFFNWVFQPENFKLIQNARGTVPVLSNMTDDQIKLPAAIAAIVGDMNAAPFVSMGFNLTTAEFDDAACTALRDLITSNGTAQAAIDTMWATEQTSYANKK
ncbi:MAG: ABC transporter substrate-binding protein [Oscillospiraceae bacterium]|nr:ABC transporter substrate-binding protein [Oscillospiraceae bacterium]